jgi:hypothetical protein
MLSRMSGKMEWEKAAKRDVVARRGGDKVAPSGVTRAVWLTDEDRERLYSVGWTPKTRQHTEISQREARSLYRTLRRLGVSREGIAELHTIADPAERAAEAHRLRSLIEERELELDREAGPHVREVRRAVKALKISLAAAVSPKRGRGAQPDGNQISRPRRLADLTPEQLELMRERRRARRRR